MINLKPSARLRILFFLAAAILLACNLIGGAGEEPTSTAVPDEVEPTLTPQATVTSEPTEVDAPDVDFEGVSFSYDSYLADEVVGEIVAAVETGEDLPWSNVPQHIQFSFIGYPLTKTFHEPRILVYPVDEFREMNYVADEEINSMEQFLMDQPAAAPDGIPFLPFWGAAQMMRSNIRYLDFQNGTGVRFLTQYGQAVWPIDNLNIFYTFQGMTDDGQQYVAAIFPISSPILPDDGAEIVGDDHAAFSETFMEYLAEVEAQLNAQGMSSFDPDLSLLDALIRSIHVE